jgi:amino acid transporter
VGPQQYGTFDARSHCISNCPNGLHSARRSNYLITMVFMFITAAVLAEICSALPLSGSIYIWAAESAGPKRARFFGFLVAWWSTTAWMTFTAGNCQVSYSIDPHPFPSRVRRCSDEGHFRQQRIILCHSSPYGGSIFPVVPEMTTLDGEHSSGVSPN